MPNQQEQVDDEVESFKTKYQLSRRGAYNALYRDIWGPRAKQMADLWTPENPTAIINLRLAENNMMHEEMAKFVTEKFEVKPVDRLTYNTRPKGSLRLRKAIARFLNDDFKSRQKVTADEIFITPGLASAIDSIFWSICNEGDGVIIPRPFYNGFKYDIQHRTGAVIVEASYTGIEGYSSLENVFDAQVMVRAFEKALVKAEKEGINVKAVMISHPHNPLGRCYPSETLIAIASFCGRHNLHFVSDEIYAHSVFHGANTSELIPFTSTLALDLSGHVDPLLHHVIYGTSKDFCANGLRLGFIYSRNTALLSGISSNAIFAWSPQALQDVWAVMFEDDEWRNSFFARNAQLMSERYAQATSFLHEKGINWFPSHTGVFIWVDLTEFITDSQRAIDSDEVALLQVGSPESEKYLIREGELRDICASHGVLIAWGSLYSTESYGWFRITFTMPRKPLREGLERLWTALKHVKKQGWK